MRLAIFGTGGMGRELLRLARDTLGPDDTLVFVSDEEETSVLGTKVIRPDALTPRDKLIISLGSSKLRRQVTERFPDLDSVILKAGTAIIGPDVEIGQGAVFCDFTMVTASAMIGRQFQCNIYSYVAHDCVIGDYVTFAPRVCCNGNVHVHDGAYIGTGAVIKQGSREDPLVIGADAIVGMGAVVTKNVAAGATVVGNPARPLSK